MLSLYFEPDIAANAVIMTGIARELVKRGHEVTVVCAFPHYAKNMTQDQFRGRLVDKEKRGGLTIIRTYIYTAPEKDRFLVRFFNYLSFNVLSTLAGMFSGPQDILFAPSPPLTVGLSAALIGWIKRIPYVYNVQDINPDVLIKLGILTNPLVISFSKMLEKFVYQRAEHVTVLSEGFKRNLLGKEVPERKMTIIPNFIDPDFIQPLPKDNAFREECGVEGKFVILYAGNLGHSQNLELLLECAHLLRKREKFAFLIVGNGSRKPVLVDKASELGLQNLQFVPFQPRERVPEIYAAADLSLVTLKRGIAVDSVPSKVYTIMASCRPVVAAVDPGSDTWRLVEDADCGLCLEPEDPGELAETILALSSQEESLDRLGKNGREYVLRYHTRKQVGKKYDQLFRSLK